jgi:CRP/FNR family transcriptional regulator, cyclic AMP receptor protein
VSVPTLAGHTLVVDYLEPGKVIGELALIDGVHRSATVSAVVTSRLLAIERQNFLAYLQRHPAASLALLTELAKKIRQFNQGVQESHASSLADRLARKLIALGQRFGQPTDDGLLIDLHLPQRELGDLIGYSRESVNKQLAAWSAAGAVRVGRSRLVIRDVAALVREIDIEV